jgi:hypothetical protein
MFVRPFYIVMSPRIGADDAKSAMTLVREASFPLSCPDPGSETYPIISNIVAAPPDTDPANRTELAMR